MAIESVTGSTAVGIKKIHFDSRLISVQDVFVAIKGKTADGHAFIETAIAKGATVIADFRIWFMNHHYARIFRSFRRKVTYKG